MLKLVEMDEKVTISEQMELNVKSEEGRKWILAWIMPTLIMNGYAI